MLRVLHLAPGYELVLKTLFSVVRRQNSWKTTDPQQVLGLGSPSNLNISHYYQQYEKQAGDIRGRDWGRGDEEGWVGKEILEG